MKRQALLTLLATLGGCVANIDAPATVSPVAENAEFAHTDLTSVGPVPNNWWKLYDNRQLDALVQESLRANVDLRIAYANLDAVRAVASQARAARYPQTSVESGLTVDNTTQQPSAFGVPSTDWDLGISASWDLDLFGRLRATALAAEANTQVQEAAVDGTRLAVAADTVQAYVEFCAFGAAIDVASEVAAGQDRFVDLVERQVRAGEATPLAVAQAATQAATLRADIPPLRAGRLNAAYRLAVLQGRAPTASDAQTIDCNAHAGLRADVPVGDASALLLRRPDIREAERRLAGATARLGVARADLYPRLNLGGTVGLLSGDVSSTLTPLLSWSFPNQGPVRARIDQAEALEQVALANWDAVVLNALRDVESALVNYDAQYQRNRELAVASENAKTYARRAAAQVRLGAAAGLLQVDAERTLASAILAKAQSDLSLAQTEVGLFRALGGGWQVQD